MLKFVFGSDCAQIRWAATTSVAKFLWDRMLSISSALKLSSLSRSTAASTSRPSAEMKSARRGSEVGASESCVSGTTKFFNRLKASWKRFASSCSNPLPDPSPARGGGEMKTPQAGREIEAPTLPSPASGGGKKAPTLPSPASGGGKKTPQAGRDFRSRV